ncbi:MAG: hypothetical protein HY749_12630 [Gammaproteobacteria bacterium]|nr:hypothetical protein [Gammaproteobacteria bacterium]
MIETSLELALLILAAELAILAFVLLFVFMRKARRKEAQVEAEATALVEKVEVSDSGRREALTTIFKNTYKFDDDEADTAVSQFVERERAFYNFLLAVHLGRGGKKLTDVPNELAKVVAPWLRITPKKNAEIDDLTQEKNDLTEQKTKLETELADTKRVMEDLLAEYSAAFRKGEEPLTMAEAAPQPPPAPAADDGLLSMDDFAPPPEPAAPPAAAAPIAEEAAPAAAEAEAEPEPGAAADPDAIHLEDIDDLLPPVPAAPAVAEAVPEVQAPAAVEVQELADVEAELAAAAAEPLPAHHGLDFDIGDDSDAPTAVLPDGGTADMSRMTEADIDALIESLDHGPDDHPKVA